MKYDISDRLSPAYSAEYVVPLPMYPDPDEDPDDNLRVAKQSEIHALANGQFLVLARDGGAGHGQARSESVYRHVDVFDISAATDIRTAGRGKGKEIGGDDYDCQTCAIATTKAALDGGISPARYCAWLDFNVSPQLARFGLHNGGAQDAALLNEKWESIALAPVLAATSGGHPESMGGWTRHRGDGNGDADADAGEYFLFSLSDNDFVTQHGFMNGGRLPYADSSGYNIDNQALVFKVRIPS